jgi:hypothetical protein
VLEALEKKFPDGFVPRRLDRVPQPSDQALILGSRNADIGFDAETKVARTVELLDEVPVDPMDAHGCLPGGP